MKVTAILMLALGAVALSACDSSAQDEAQATADAIREMTANYGPPKVSTSSGGYEMHAVVDGEPWSAESMMEINASNDDFVHGEGDGIEIGFYIYRDFAKTGKASPLGPGHAADLYVGDELWGARSGEYVFTKLGDDAIEGTFHFTAKKFQSEETMEVTDGTFRLPLQ